MTVPPPIILADWGDAARHIITRLEHIAGRLALMETTMATKADLEASLSRLQTAVTTKVGDVSAQLAAMQSTLDGFVRDDATEDAAYQAQIDDLKAQLQSQLADAVASVNAMADAVSGQPA